MIHIERRVHILREFLIQVACSPIAAGVCAVGVALSAIAVLQRENGSLAKNTILWTGYIGGAPSSLFGCVVKFINPNAPFEAQRNRTILVPSTSPKTSFCHSLTSRKLLLAAIDCYQKPNPLKKYVFSRALFALSGIVAIVARTADLALGLVAATFAIITLGTQKKLNDFAYNNLTFLLSIRNVIIAVRGFINPAISQHYQEAVEHPPVPDPVARPPAPPLVRGASFTALAPKKEKINIPLDPLDFVAYDHIPEMLLEDCVLQKYECSIGFKPIRNPVLDLDGVTLYERSAILEWLEKDNTSPTTRQPLSEAQFIEMPALKALIDSRLSLHAKSIRTEKGFDLNTPADLPLLQEAADRELKLLNFHIAKLRLNSKFDVFSYAAIKEAVDANIISNV